jgi:hypothetical protein
LIGSAPSAAAPVRANVANSASFALARKIEVVTMRVSL